MAAKPQQTPDPGITSATQYLAAIIESSDDAIVSKDLNGIVTSWNRAAERMFGYTAEEMIGRPIATIAAPEVSNEMPAILERLRRGERIDHYETVRVHKNGQRVYVSLTVSPVRDGTGKIIGASKIARDISERRRLEQRAAELLERERAGREAAENAMRLHKEAERKLGLMVEASDRLLGSLDAREVLQRTLDLATRFVACDACAVWRLSPVDGVWRIAESVGLADDFDREYQADATNNALLDDGVLAIGDVFDSSALERRRMAYLGEHVRALMAAPMRVNGRLTGTLTFYFRTTRAFSEIERRIASALANLAASAISSTEIYQEQKRLRDAAQAAAARSNMLAQASVILGSTLDFQQTLRSVAELVVPGFADWCAVDLIGGDGSIERVATSHVDPAKVEAARRLRERYPASMDSTRGVAQVIRAGKPVLHEQITEEALAAVAFDEEHLQMLREAGLSSAMLAHMLARGKPIGAILFAMAESGRRYSANDLEIAEQVAVRAALAIDNAHLFAAAERDRADAHAAVKALQESNAELEQFAYVSSHDLQEPLRTVASYAQLLEQRYRGRLDKDADDFIGFIVEGAVRMSGLIEGLLRYSRLISAQPLAMKPTDSGASLEAALGNLTKAIEETGATVTSDPLPRVQAQAVQLVQVFQNLISNAIKYRGKEPPRIHVAAKADGSVCTFSVADNGIGIEPEYWDRIFGLFKRLHGRDIPGTGIGLATCKRIIEKHGGRIWLESVPGSGTTFYFTLNLASQGG